MKLRYIATALMTGMAAAAIAAAPGASAANPSTTTNTGGATIIDKQGHTAITVHPRTVSPPRVYGPFAGPMPIVLFD
jgi:hypothetical protein